MSGIKKAANSAGNTGKRPHISTRESQANNSMTKFEVLEKFRQILVENGAIIDQLKPDQGLIRSRAQGDKGSKKSFFYNIHTDGVPSMAYGNFRTGLNTRTHIKANNVPLDPFERAQLAKKYEAEKLKREGEQQARYKDARKIAHAIWASGSPAPCDHPYLVRKMITESAPNFKVNNSGHLLVPIFKSGRITSIQFIHKDNFSKWFLKNSELKGAGFMFKSLNKSFDRMYLCEGASTGATLHYHLTEQENVVCAMNCGNLKALALTLRKKHPDKILIIAGDNDYRSDGSINIGVKKAHEAAAASGGLVSIPKFPNPEQGGDWNDLYSQSSKGAKA